MVWKIYLFLMTESDIKTISQYLKSGNAADTKELDCLKLVELFNYLFLSTFLRNTFSGIFT